jgi:hypothetical protein
MSIISYINLKNYGNISSRYVQLLMAFLTYSQELS